jgi:hypothetical protein
MHGEFKRIIYGLLVRVLLDGANDISCYRGKLPLFRLLFIVVLWVFTYSKPLHNLFLGSIRGSSITASSRLNLTG